MLERTLRQPYSFHPSPACNNAPICGLSLPHRRLTTSSGRFWNWRNQAEPSCAVLRASMTNISGKATLLPPSWEVWRLKEVDGNHRILDVCRDLKSIREQRRWHRSLNDERFRRNNSIGRNIRRLPYRWEHRSHHEVLQTTSANGSTSVYVYLGICSPVRWRRRFHIHSASFTVTRPIFSCTSTDGIMELTRSLEYRPACRL